MQRTTTTARPLRASALLWVFALASAASVPTNLTAQTRERAPLLAVTNDESSASTVHRHLLSNGIQASQAAFQENQGQFERESSFGMRLPNLHIGAEESAVLFQARSRSSTLSPSPLSFRLIFDGSSPLRVIEPIEQASGLTNYFKRSQNGSFLTGIRSYYRLRYKGIYPGVDAEFYLSGGGPEIDFVIQPNADPSKIGIRPKGVGSQLSIELCATGEVRLVNRQNSTVAILARPIAYQDIGGVRSYVECAMRRTDSGCLRFDLGDYDRQRVLVIDPIVQLSTFLGGTLGDSARRVKLDAQGSTYVVGDTAAAAFPVSPSTSWIGGLGGSPQQRDVFVSKVDASGSHVFTTYFGGSGDDYGYDIEVDSLGRCYVTGETDSVDLPIVGAIVPQSTLGGASDAYFFRLSIDGSALDFVTYYGGSQSGGSNANGEDGALGLATSPSGDEVDLCGRTFSPDFPISSPISIGLYTGAAHSSALAPPTTAYADAFVARFSIAASPTGLITVTPIFSTFLGGTGTDIANDIDRNAAGVSVLVGQTSSAGAGAFPTIRAPMPVHSAAIYDSFLLRLNWDSTSSSLTAAYSTFYGGPTPAPNSSSTGETYGLAVAVTTAGDAVFVGRTFATNLPTPQPTPPGQHIQPYQPGSTSSGFAARVAHAGFVVPAAFVWTTYLGAGPVTGQLAYSTATDVDVDSSGSAFIVGTTDSSSMPIVDPVQAVLSGGEDAFYCRIDGNGIAFVQSSFVGGGAQDNGLGVCVAPEGNDFRIVGASALSAIVPFPLVGPIQASYGGGATDAFICRIVDDDISVSPTAIDFRRQPINSITTKNILIRNTGLAPLTIIGMSQIQLPFSYVSPGIPTVIAPGATVTVPISFRPTAPGAYSATLLITSDDVDEPVVAVAFTGAA